MKIQRDRAVVRRAHLELDLVDARVRPGPAQQLIHQRLPDALTLMALVNGDRQADDVRRHRERERLQERMPDDRARTLFMLDVTVSGYYEMTLRGA